MKVSLKKIEIIKIDNVRKNYLTLSGYSDLEFQSKSPRKHQLFTAFAFYSEITLACSQRNDGRQRARGNAVLLARRCLTSARE